MQHACASFAAAEVPIFAGKPSANTGIIAWVSYQTQGSDAAHTTAAGVLAQARATSKPSKMQSNSADGTLMVTGQTQTTMRLTMASGGALTTVSPKVEAVPATAIVSEMPLERYIDLHAALERGTGSVQSFSAMEAVMFRMADLKQVQLMQSESKSAPRLA